MPIRSWWLHVVLLGPVLAGNLSAQGIRGRVLDADTDQPVPGVSVTLVDARQEAVSQVLTDAAGAFYLRVTRSDRFHLRLERIGYADVTSPPFDMTAGDTLVVELHMSTRAVPLAPLTITAGSRRSWRDRAMDDFYERQRRGWGRFFGPAELERIRPPTVTSLLQATPGVRIHYGRGTEARVLMRTGRGECVPRIYLDGHLLPGNDVDSWVSATTLRAVEVYSRAMETPVEFQSVRGWDCGAVALWTLP